MKVLVLCGGASPERVVSLSSGDAVGAWLSEAGHEVVKYDPEVPGVVHSQTDKMAPKEIGLDAPAPKSNGQWDTRVVQGLLDVLQRVRPEIVFPIFHGGYGENGTVQALLDWVGIPYTGSGMLASAIAMNKNSTVLVLRSIGVPVPESFMVARHTLTEYAAVAERVAKSFGFPIVVKPLCGGSTVGLTKVRGEEELASALDAVLVQGDDALVEAHFTGRELTVTIVDGEAFPVIEIRPKVGYYDYSNKYTSGRTEYLCPAPIDASVAQQMQRAAITAFGAVGCRGFARVDFLLNDANRFVCLEINTLPGMTLHSLVPKAARAAGLEPPQLMQKVIESARRNFASVG
jgi:D-alanine-D-alanine ligase